MRWRRMVLVVAVPLVVAGAGTLLTIASNVATGGSSPWFPAIERHPLWWTVGATAAVAGVAVLAGWSQRLAERELAALIPPVQRPERWVVDRPAEVGRIVRALRVSSTTAVQGAGGFGKTTVAKLVRADRRVLRRFGGRVYWVTLGRDVRRDALVSKVNDLVRQIDPGQAQPFTDVQQAADHLAKVLAAGPSRLVVLDDVWFDDQLAAFPVAGRCARLVTTRVPTLVSGHTVAAVPVDQMSDVQARAVLLADLPDLPPDVISGLLAETGRWPLLLRLVNRVLRDQVRLRTDSAVVGRELLEALRHGGVTEVDRLTGAAPQRLDVGDPRQRVSAVAATIEAGRGLLAPLDRARLAELSIFAEDDPVPAALVATLWRATGGIDRLAADAMCARLADLALVTLEPTDAGGTVGMHDVLRDFLRGELGPATVADLNRRLLDAIAAGLPVEPDDPPRIGTPWWRLPEADGYLWNHLVEHLCAAGAAADAEALVSDLRWVAARLERSGPAAPLADLRHLDTPQTIRLRGLLGQAAHLLTPTDPPHSCVDVLLSRMADDPDWGPQARMLTAGRVAPTLVNDWPLPDLPDPALRRVLTDHTDWVYAMAIAPDGTWLATGGSDATVLIWDTATWQRRAVLTNHWGKVSAAVVAPDGTWLATGDDVGAVRIWDTSCWQELRTLHLGRRVNALAVAPDGTWLAVGTKDRSIRIWKIDRWREQAPLVGRRSSLNDIGSIAVAPDGTWLAAVSGLSTVRIWDVVTGTVRAELSGNLAVYGVAVAPDGTWMATVDASSHLRIWATDDWRELRALRYSGRVNAVAVAPDGTWLAAAGEGGDLRLWDTTTWEQRMRLIGSTVMAVAPDGTWLAAGSTHRVRVWDTLRPRQRAAADRSRFITAVAVAPDGTWYATGDQGDAHVRIWDQSGMPRATLAGHTKWWVNDVAVAPDGTWLATAGGDDTVRIWDTATWQPRSTLTGHDNSVYAVASAPDGSWLASVGHDGTVQVWDVETGVRQALMYEHRVVCAVVVAPDGTWLATGGWDDTVRIWDATTWRQRAILTGHTNWVDGLAIAPDGTWLASVSRDDTTRIWETTTWRQHLRLTDPAATALAVAPDGRTLATAGHTGEIKLWDPSTGHSRAMMRVDGGVRACAWSPTGNHLVVGGTAGLYQFTMTS
ncbi:hypothetical protein DI270_012790 [Microbispora triticiradicis]|uniref:NB-ARC domain-containing protein n=1 Tax=Microbispora triticiradicis TaxID=2200763 RepID=A0ABX9LLP2_9ACTN|nr:NB-ARC domain-containing protein [Microbispora triticiradicis]RGA04578.1 hypothetical protein DI270_012790 [Microbispora triticiradicis]